MYAGRAVVAMPELCDRPQMQEGRHKMPVERQGFEPKTDIYVSTKLPVREDRLNFGAILR
jgi:hypothetical protein